MIRLLYWLVSLFDWFNLTALSLTKNEAIVEFATDHPSLLAKDAPHETRGVLRMHRAGWTGVMMCKLLGIAQPNLTSQLKDAIDEEGSAAAAKRPIYDARVPRGTR